MKSVKLTRTIALSCLLLAIYVLPSASFFISQAQEQTVPASLKGTRWQALQPNETYSRSLDRSLTREFFCSFGKRGKVSCSVIVTAASKVKDEQYYDPISRRLKYRKILIPRQTLTTENRVGTYEQNGNSVRIELYAYEIEATVEGNRMEGELTLKLESNQRTRWVGRRITGESSK